MELFSDRYHLDEEDLREMTIDVLNWLNWRIVDIRNGHLEVTTDTEQGNALLDLEIVTCGNADATEDSSAHCLKVSFPQSATGPVGVLLDELHAAALKRTLNTSL